MGMQMNDRPRHDVQCGRCGSRWTHRELTELFLEAKIDLPSRCPSCGSSALHELKLGEEP